MKKKIYFDMDGTLALWRASASRKAIFTPGYYLNLPPYIHVVDLCIELINRPDEYEVFLLGCTLSEQADNEKRLWCERNGIKLDKDHMIFLPCGKNKADYIGLESGELGILIDDHTPNLLEFEQTGPNYIGIKMLNGINGSGGRWNGRCLTIYDTLTVELLEKVIAGETVTVYDGSFANDRIAIRSFYQAEHDTTPYFSAMFAIINAEGYMLDYRDKFLLFEKCRALYKECSKLTVEIGGKLCKLMERRFITWEDIMKLTPEKAFAIQCGFFNAERV